MRLDHVALRIADREATAKFYQEAFGYKIQQRFQIPFDNGTFADSIAMEPPEKIDARLQFIEPVWSYVQGIFIGKADYHLAPEIFVSDGEPGSIVGDWVAARRGIGGIHHLAYAVKDIEGMVKLWQDKGLAEFTSEIIDCPEEGLRQVFTKEHPLTGIVYELIERNKFGFCLSSVKKLMEKSTQ